MSGRGIRAYARSLLELFQLEDKNPVKTASSSPRFNETLEVHWSLHAQGRYRFSTSFSVGEIFQDNIQKKNLECILEKIYCFK